MAQKTVTATNIVCDFRAHPCNHELLFNWLFRGIKRSCCEKPLRHQVGLWMKTSQLCQSMQIHTHILGELSVQFRCGFCSVYFCSECERTKLPRLFSRIFYAYLFRLCGRSSYPNEWKLENRFGYILLLHAQRLNPLSIQMLLLRIRALISIVRMHFAIDELEKWTEENGGDNTN